MARARSFGNIRKLPSGRYQARYWRLGKQVAADTTFASKIMTTAVDDGLIARNPVRIKGASAERMVERPLLTWDDVRALAGAIHPRFGCLVWTAAASGLRFGELAGLTIEHVNLERREVRVTQALHDIKGQGPTLGPPKTETPVRTVPVAESIAVWLAAHVEEYVEDVEPGSLVFTSLRGGPLLRAPFPERAVLGAVRPPAAIGGAIIETLVTVDRACFVD